MPSARQQARYRSAAARLRPEASHWLYVLSRCFLNSAKLIELPTGRTPQRPQESGTPSDTYPAPCAHSSMSPPRITTSDSHRFTSEDSASALRQDASAADSTKTAGHGGTSPGATPVACRQPTETPQRLTASVTTSLEFNHLRTPLRVPARLAQPLISSALPLSRASIQHDYCEHQTSSPNPQAANDCPQRGTQLCAALVSFGLR